MLDTRNADTKSIRITDTFCVHIADTESVRNGIWFSITWIKIVVVSLKVKGRLSVVNH